MFEEYEALEAQVKTTMRSHSTCYLVACFNLLFGRRCYCTLEGALNTVSRPD